MQTRTSSKKLRQRQKRRKARAAHVDRTSHDAGPSTASSLRKQLMGVFGPQTGEMLTRALSGESPESIAAALDVPLERVEKFIDRITSLPSGLTEQLLRAPTLLEKGEQFSSVMKSAVRAARRRSW